MPSLVEQQVGESEPTVPIERGPKKADASRQELTMDTRSGLASQLNLSRQDIEDYHTLHNQGDTGSD